MLETKLNKCTLCHATCTPSQNWLVEVFYKQIEKSISESLNVQILVAGPIGCVRSNQCESVVKRAKVFSRQFCAGIENRQGPQWLAGVLRHNRLCPRFSIVTIILARASRPHTAILSRVMESDAHCNMFPHCREWWGARTDDTTTGIVVGRIEKQQINETMRHHQRQSAKLGQHWISPKHCQQNQYRVGEVMLCSWMWIGISLG